MIGTAGQGGVDEQAAGKQLGCCLVLSSIGLGVGETREVGAWARREIGDSGRPTTRATGTDEELRICIDRWIPFAFGGVLDSWPD